MAEILIGQPAAHCPLRIRHPQQQLRQLATEFGAVTRQAILKRGERGGISERVAQAGDQGTPATGGQELAHATPRELAPSSPSRKRRRFTPES